MRTFGVEEEFLIVDPGSGQPLPLAGEVLALHGLGGQATGSSGTLILSPELQQEQLEAATHPHSSLRELALEIRAGRAYADSLASTTVAFVGYGHGPCNGIAGRGVGVFGARVSSGSRGWGHSGGARQ
ncbi:MAG: glutamate-cysteine ligase family protein [Actinomycetota bacterium]|nr:glutamate-cysteine ligase family protein [Actinomycetota bacterium]